MSIEAKVDFSSALAGLERLAGEARVSLARSMAVAGGQVFRDEAKLRAPVKTGRLRDSIYLAFRDGKSTDQQVMYSVTWNSKKAPHGHLVEFGHWQVVAAAILGWLSSAQRISAVSGGMRDAPSGVSP